MLTRLYKQIESNITTNLKFNLWSFVSFSFKKWI